MHRDSESAVEAERRRVQEEVLAKHVSPTDWQNLSDKFTSGSRFLSALFQITDGITIWSFYDESGRAMCMLAGSMLLASPAIAAHLPKGVIEQTDHVTRWLQYLKETTRKGFYRDKYLSEELPDGKNEFTNWE